MIKTAKRKLLGETETNRFITLYNRGLGLWEVAEATGWSYACVRRALVAAGIKRRTPGNYNSGSASPNWKGRGQTAAGIQKQRQALLGRGKQRYLTALGYVRIIKHDHPNASANGTIYEHRYVMERALGRLLNRAEIVHHKNGITSDNRLSNLELLTASEHATLHNASLSKKERKRRAKFMREVVQPQSPTARRSVW